jgi:hypothetical protein
MSDKSPLLDDFLSRPELAAELRVTERTVIRWCDRGEGPPITKLGRRPVFSRTAVAEWLVNRQGRAA